MLDLNRTLGLIRGALIDPEATWRSYLPEAGNWQKTAFLLTGPLIVSAAVIAYLMGLFSGSSLLGMFRPTIGSTIMSIVFAALGAGVVAFIVSWLAGVFGGKRSFAHGLAATTLAFVPGYLGQALSGLVWIGGLLTLGLLIYALVLLWRIIPTYLEVPDRKRGPHYALSLLASIVVMMILGGVLGAVGLGPGPRPGPVAERGIPSTPGSGVFGGLARQGELLAMAEEDSYAPPGNGRLTEAQVEAFIRVMTRAAEMRAENEQRLKAMADKADKDKDFSISDLGDLMSGATTVAGLQTAEIEVVKTAGGNWAEHQWVRETLRTAWVQKDINDTVAHNYALYQKYEDQLADIISR
jgi:MFS family permease